MFRLGVVGLYSRSPQVFTSQERKLILVSENGTTDHLSQEIARTFPGLANRSPWETPVIMPTAKRTKKIAICGRAPSTILQAPFDDDEWEIWTLGNAAMPQPEGSGVQKGALTLPRWDRLYELHDVAEKIGHWPQAYLDWLKLDHGKPIIIGAKSEHIPFGTPYPWEAVFKEFGRYFNNSISEMIAHALLEGCTHLSLYGVDMAQSDPVLHEGNPEYQHQRPSCEYMLGVAAGRGVEVFVPAESDLLKCARVYGLHADVGHSIRKHAARHKELVERHAQALNQFRFHRDQYREWEKLVARHEGALAVLAEDDPRREEAVKQRDNAAEQYKLHRDNATAWEMNKAKFEGAIEDNDYWKQRIQA